ncbi:uncharacterized protein LOC121234844 [Juglans microcarpa x Juglans regia]|uniref:uncharacterized protein LOC121234844 n=1 Tax=Juglans microcarpa x Juglans regia TaxID=2249226 RepID=UPI001B7EB7D1|nr:uncharacterized protein LOC121234844 [Juglans microcarpa x Juglans regia]
MGCASSKLTKVTVDDIYRPAPASFAVFDVNAVEEPWLKVDHMQQEHEEKPTHVPAPILEKLSKFEADAPHSWEEVSKALKLEDLKKQKPTIVGPPAKPEPEAVPPPVQDSTTTNKQTPRKSASFHTLEELDAKLSPKPTKELRKAETMRTESRRTEPKQNEARTESESEGFRPKPLKENIFILKDRLEREREGKMANFDRIKRDPLSDFQEKCPPGGGADTVVLYTTSLQGVRRTYEDCNRAREVLEGHEVVFDERDVSLHGEFLNELRELLGETARVPRLFVKGRYIGGVEELVELNEAGRLGRILKSARVERGVGRQGCEGCGGMRFVPCWECGGSCKVVKDGSEKKERCGQCNENGLVHCPACK